MQQRAGAPLGPAISLAILLEMGAQRGLPRIARLRRGRERQAQRDRPAPLRPEGRDALRRPRQGIGREIDAIHEDLLTQNLARQRLELRRRETELVERELIARGRESVAALEGRVRADRLGHRPVRGGEAEPVELMREGRVTDQPVEHPPMEAERDHVRIADRAPRLLAEGVALALQCGGKRVDRHGLLAHLGDRAVAAGGEHIADPPDREARDQEQHQPLGDP